MYYELNIKINKFTHASLYTLKSPRIISYWMHALVSSFVKIAQFSDVEVFL